MKKIKFALWGLATVLFLPNLLFSQVNFQTGFIVDKNMDTIKGLVDYQRWDVTPTAIKFKTQSESSIIQYKPNEIQCFGVSGEIYTCGIVNIEETLYKEKAVEGFPKYKYRTDTVYLQVLIRGEKSLYYRKDNDSKTYFYINPDNRFQWLIHREYLNNNYGNIFVVTDQKYKGQLNLYLVDCPTLRKNISSTGYNSKELLSLFNDYYTCKNNKTAYQIKVEKSKPEFGLIGGMSFTQIKFVGDNNFSSLISSDYPVSKRGTFGGYLNIPFPRSLNKFSFYNDLRYTSYKASYVNRSTPDEDINTVSTSSIGNNSLRLSSMIRYKFPINDMFLFVNAGISNGIATSKTNYLLVEEHVYSVSYKTEKEALKNAKNWERGFIAGLGCSYKKLGCELRIENTDGMSSYALLSSPVRSYYFLLAYRF
jgi:hypothetical protein